MTYMSIQYSLVNALCLCQTLCPALDYFTRQEQSNAGRGPGGGGLDVWDWPAALRGAGLSLLLDNTSLAGADEILLFSEPRLGDR